MTLKRLWLSAIFGCLVWKMTGTNVLCPNMSFNKIDFLFFPTGYSCCTFVSSKKANGGAARESGETLIHRFETFHEIIYGKPTRRKRAPGFFLPLLPVFNKWRILLK